MKRMVVVLSLFLVGLSFGLRSAIAAEGRGKARWVTETGKEIWVRTSPRDTFGVSRPDTIGQIESRGLPERVGRVGVQPGSVQLTVGLVRDSVVMLGGQRGTVEISVIRTPSFWPEAVDWWACLLGAPRPERVIRSLRFSSGGDTQDLPLSSYFNLGDPDWLFVQGDSLGAVITVRGSEGCNAWTARWWIRDGQLAKSRVELTDDPGAKWRETVWVDDAVYD
jgi:hypothetical protein